MTEEMNDKDAHSSEGKCTTEGSNSGVSVFRFIYNFTFT